MKIQKEWHQYCEPHTVSVTEAELERIIKEEPEQRRLREISIREWEKKRKLQEIAYENILELMRIINENTECTATPA